MLRASISLLALLAFPTVSSADAPQSKEGAPVTPTDFARLYFEAMDNKDLDMAEVLFAESSSIFETGGAEGDWEHYRAHHIGAELDAIKTFETTLGEPEEEISADGAMAFVAWPIEYNIILQDGRVIDSRGTVTFVFVRSQGHFRIRHMHWSSRRLVKPPN